MFNLLLFGGWLLGVIGFFRAGRARAELRELRRLVVQSDARSAAPPEPFAAASPGIPAPAFYAPPTPRQEPDATAMPQPVPSAAADLEALLTMQWGVWLGAAALVFAGIFLVRYAVDQALLGPAARCGLAAMLGVALIAGAEWLQRRDRPVTAGPFAIDRAPAGLAAGGVSILFGAAYGAGPFYLILDPLTAFGAMAAASFIGLAAALRYGPLVAAVGLVGAFATPALVATDAPTLPGLFTYLFVVYAAALFIVRRTAWTWLGWATTIAGALWVCAAAISTAPDQWAAAAFVPAAALLNLLLLPSAALDHPIGHRLSWVPFASLGAACLVVECLVPGAAPRLALLLLSPIAIWKGATEPRLDRLPWLAALLGLLSLLVWALPLWRPSVEFAGIHGLIEALLPGTWAPQVIRPLLLSAMLLAACHAAAGLWLERRAAHPLHWAALVAAVPVATLATTYAQIARFQADTAWALAAASLAALLTAIAARAARRDARQLAGIHAAGATAALALGCAMLLHEHWLTLAIALFLPALAWIEARADLPPLRRVALAVAALVLVRLTLNWYVLDYVFGNIRLANGLVAAYAAPATAFLVAAMMFRRRADDLLVATLEAGGIGLTACYVALEIRHSFGDGRLTGPISFSESAWQLLTLTVQAVALLHIAGRTGRPVLHWAWRIAGGMALACGMALLVINPALTNADAGIASLAAAYAAPAALAMLARRQMPTADLRDGLTLYAVVSGFVWMTLQIREAFHPGAIGLYRAPVADAELWAWSGAWLAYGVALMMQGIRAGDRLLRMFAMAVVGLVCAKVFLVDMSDLAGLWRVLSFLGLGLALIGLGAVYRRFVLPTKQA